MAKATLIDMVQNILSAMSSDQVSHIDDTDEARQVAAIIKETYEELMATRDWPHLETLVRLDGSNDEDAPTIMWIPSEVSELNWIKYDKSKEGEPQAFEDVQYLDPKDFMDMVHGRNSEHDNVEVVSHKRYYDGMDFNVYNDVPPTYWTSPGELVIVFDSYNKAVDDTLHKDKTSCMGVYETVWLESDDFIPRLPAKMFPMLLAEAKHVAMLNLRQIDNGKEASKARRQMNTMQHRSNRSSLRKGYKAYGR